jgi:hypothetical protein
MATALPPASDWTAVDTTEGEFKIAQTNLRAYLAGLLGTNGTISTARATLEAAKLGANTDITSLDAPELGAATATTQATSDDTTKVATTAFVQDVVGEIDIPTLSSLGGVSTDMGHDAVGSICMVARTSTSETTVNPGATIAGSSLVAAGIHTNDGGAATFVLHGAALSGTWRILGVLYTQAFAGGTTGITLAQRIS